MHLKAASSSKTRTLALRIRVSFATGYRYEQAVPGQVRPTADIRPDLLFLTIIHPFRNLICESNEMSCHAAGLRLGCCPNPARSMGFSISLILEHLLLVNVKCSRTNVLEGKSGGDPAWCASSGPRRDRARFRCRFTAVALLCLWRRNRIRGLLPRNARHGSNAHSLATEALSQQSNLLCDGDYVTSSPMQDTLDTRRRAVPVALAQTDAPRAQSRAMKALGQINFLYASLANPIRPHPCPALPLTPSFRLLLFTWLGITR